MDGLKLKWRRTWPDVEADFVGWHGHDRAGRMYHTPSAGKETAPWRWFCNGELPGGGTCTGGGGAWTPREAAAALESYWFDAIERCASDSHPVAQNPGKA